MKTLLLAALAFGALCTVHATWVADSVDVSLCTKSGSGTWFGSYAATGVRSISYGGGAEADAYDEIFGGSNGAQASNGMIALRVKFHLHWVGANQPKSGGGSVTIFEDQISEYAGMKSCALYGVGGGGSAMCHAQCLGFVPAAALNFSYGGVGWIDPSYHASGTRTTVPMPIELVGTNDYVGEFNGSAGFSASGSASRGMSPGAEGAGRITMSGTITLDSVDAQPL